MTAIEQTELAKKFTPLVKKITNQYLGKCKISYEDIEGYAWEGFTRAMNTYDNKRSNMSFKSFAAFGIRNSILNGLKENNSTNISYYFIKKYKKEGLDLPTTISIEKNFENEDHLAELGIEDNVSTYDPWTVVINKLYTKFPDKWVNAFCEINGIGCAKLKKSKEVAEELHVSCPLVSKTIKQMVNFIKNDKESLEYLSELI